MLFHDKNVVRLHVTRVDAPQKVYHSTAVISQKFHRKPPSYSRMEVRHQNFMVVFFVTGLELDSNQHVATLALSFLFERLLFVRTQICEISVKKHLEITS